jgi:HAD superfamily hydrolase (TIGR01509 family)
LHRIAYNKAFEKFGLKLPGGIPVIWDTHYYDKLQNTVGGGKPKMKWYFGKDAAAMIGLAESPEGGVWPYSTRPYSTPPTSDKQKSDLVDKLQDAKTEFYVEAVQKMASARPGVLELMDAAIKDPAFKVGICSAATKAGFETLVNSVVGSERLNKLDVILAGDDVKNKKPDPEIYNTAKGLIGMSESKCIVVEDSIVGLKAAKAAGMRCIITYTSSTEKEDFKSLGADAVLSDLGATDLNIIKSYFSAAVPGSESAPVIAPSPIVAPATDAKVDEVAFAGWTPGVLVLKK